ncbi:MAG TPA: hypothetical protein V6D29_14460 [Leptolyngbyaceae cyanobacterium]
MGFWSWQEKVEERINQLPSSAKQELARLRKQAIAHDGKAARELQVFIREHFTEQVDLAVVGEMSDLAIAQATEAITMAVLGHTIDELYSKPRTRRNHRDTLPAAAQNALSMGEMTAANKLEDATFDGDTWERINQVNKICREAGGQVRRWLPW